MLMIDPQTYLYEEVNHSSWGAEHDLGLWRDYPAGVLQAVSRHLMDVEPHGALAELDGLADAHAGPDERRLESPHLASPQVHLAEGQLEEIEVVFLILVLRDG